MQGETQTNEAQTKVLNELIEMDAQEVDVMVSSCQSKFRTPWKTEHGNGRSFPARRPQEIFATAFESSSTQFSGVRFEVSREVQSDLEGRLWQRLTPQHHQPTLTTSRSPTSVLHDRLWTFCAAAQFSDILSSRCFCFS